MIGHVQHVERKVVARSHNLRPTGNATVRFMFVVELHVTVNSIKIFSVAHKCSWGECVAGNNEALISADRRKDMAKLMRAFRDNANAPKRPS